jgi:large subunit ribosomal protein L1
MSSVGEWAIGGIMDKKQIQIALEELKKEKSRKFSQSYDLIVTLRDLDIKAHPVDAFVLLPHSRGKKVRICALVGQELADSAKTNTDTVIRETDMDKIKGDKKQVKQLSEQHDFFIAQANLMPQVAAAFGRTLGPRGKMPNPKAGGVVPPNADLASVRDRLQKTVQLKTKAAPMVQCIVGSEDMDDAQIVDNVMTAYTQLTKLLPAEANNVKSVLLKKTMSKVVNV